MPWVGKCWKGCTHSSQSTGPCRLLRSPSPLQRGGHEPQRLRVGVPVLPSPPKSALPLRAPAPWFSPLICWLLLRTWPAFPPPLVGRGPCALLLLPRACLPGRGSPLWAWCSGLSVASSARCVPGPSSLCVGDGGLSRRPLRLFGPLFLFGLLALTLLSELISPTVTSTKPCVCPAGQSFAPRPRHGHLGSWAQWARSANCHILSSDPIFRSSVCGSIIFRPWSSKPCLSSATVPLHRPSPCPLPPCPQSPLPCPLPPCPLLCPFPCPLPPCPPCSPSPCPLPLCLLPYPSHDFCLRSVSCLCSLATVLPSLERATGVWTPLSAGPPVQPSPWCSRTGDVIHQDLLWGFPGSMSAAGGMGVTGSCGPSLPALCPAAVRSPWCSAPICLSVFLQGGGGVIWDGTRARRGHARENPPPQCESLFSPCLCDMGLFPHHGGWPATLLGGHTVARCEVITWLCSVPENTTKGRALWRVCTLVDWEHSVPSPPQPLGTESCGPLLAPLSPPPGTP